MIYNAKVGDCKTAPSVDVTKLRFVVDIAICDLGLASVAGAAGGTWVYGVIYAVMAGGACFPLGG